MAEGHERKLSRNQVHHIRRLYKKRCPHCGHRRYLMKDLAAKYGVTPALISMAINRKGYFNRIKRE
jgi:DNA-binding MarR family transcriptional regulator